MELLRAIFGNVFGIDGLIILLVLGNIFFIGFMVRKTSGKIEESLKQVVYRPLDEILKQISPETEEKKEKEK